MLSAQPYGTAHDVWSFSILLWELLSSKTPFEEEYKTCISFVEAVVDNGMHPSLDSRWPHEIKHLLHINFYSDKKERLTMEEILSVLKHCTHDAIVCH